MCILLTTNRNIQDLPHMYNNNNFERHVFYAVDYSSKYVGGQGIACEGYLRSRL